MNSTYLILGIAIFLVFYLLGIYYIYRIKEEICDEMLSRDAVQNHDFAQMMKTALKEHKALERHRRWENLEGFDSLN